MRHPYRFAALVSLAISAQSVWGLPTMPSLSTAVEDKRPEVRPHPLVIWHGLGDTYNGAGILALESQVKKMYPGIFVHSVAVMDDPSSDERAGFFGNANDQLAKVCLQLAALPELDNGFDAIGFSQGGQFLRAYVQRCGSGPGGRKVRNLVTFGSQHMGIAAFPLCRPADLLCRLAEAAARGGVYSHYAQENLIQAQYYRDPAHYERYLAANAFIADLNNEMPASSPTRNETYKSNLLELANFVMIMFTRDKTVVPRESSWFSSYPVPDNSTELESWGDPPVPLPLRESPIYLEDHLGLKELDEQGRLSFVECEGEHMQISKECLLNVLVNYVGSPLEKVDHWKTRWDEEQVPESSLVFQAVVTS